MAAISLKLSTPQGDFIGDLPIAGVDVSQPQAGGESASIDEVYAALEAAVSAEHFTIVDDPIDFRLAASRAMLRGAGEAGDISIPVTVRPIEAGSEEESEDTFADLFDPGLHPKGG